MKTLYSPKLRSIANTREARYQFHEHHKRLLTSGNPVEFYYVGMIEISHKASFVHDFFDLFLC